MILEGIVTTIASDGELNIAPMGPVVDEAMRQLTFRPYNTSHTYQNLKAHGEGVFHVTDDVLLLAQAALGPVSPIPEMIRADTILGYIIADACRFYEFRIVTLDDSRERVVMEAEVTRHGWKRDFFGFNRAKHAVVEGAILATRTGFLPIAEILAEFRELEVIVRKTGGAREIEAFAFLKAHVEQSQGKKRDA